MYLVEDTVEKSIYEISVDRRMSHIGHAATQSAKAAPRAEAIESQLEAANTLELQQAPLSRLLTKGPGGGEMVDKEDLWNCLFRQQREQGRQMPTEVEREVGRHLRAEAAEGRRGPGDGHEDLIMADAR